MRRHPVRIYFALVFVIWRPGSFVSIALQPGGALGGARLLASLLVTPAIMWLLVAAVGMVRRWRLL